MGWSCFPLPKTGASCLVRLHRMCVDHRETKIERSKQVSERCWVLPKGHLKHFWKDSTFTKAEKRGGVEYKETGRDEVKENYEEGKHDTQRPRGRVESGGKGPQGWTQLVWGGEAEWGVQVLNSPVHADSFQPLFSGPLQSVSYRGQYPLIPHILVFPPHISFLLTAAFWMSETFMNTSWLFSVSFWCPWLKPSPPSSYLQCSVHRAATENHVHTHACCSLSVCLMRL